METVRQGCKRLNRPEILTIDEVQAIMHEIANYVIRMAVLVAGAT